MFDGTDIRTTERIVALAFGGDRATDIREADRQTGISSLGGIVTNHAIVLFEYAKREMVAGEPMERAHIIAGTTRLRPIMLTVPASIAGLLPLAFSTQTLWRPA